MATKMTYASIRAQIAKLEKQADALRASELAGVIQRIKVAIEAYGLTAEDLGLAASRAARGAGTVKAAKPASKRNNKVKIKVKRPSVIRFKDSNGNSWTGFGPKPRWYKEALAAGASVESLQADAS